MGLLDMHSRSVSFWGALFQTARGKFMPEISVDPVVSYRMYGDTVKEKTDVTWTRSALAGEAGVGVETLRFYEQEGLLDEPQRNASGYRIYGMPDLERLLFIRRSQGLGFSLQDIKQLLKLTGNILTPRKDVRDFAEARLTVIRQKIEDLKAMESALDSLIHQCNGKGALTGCPIADFMKDSKGGCHHE